MKVVCIDGSQMEFRVIAHYMQDERALQAFRDGHDFHSWVAEISGMKRKPAKTLNFAMAYGAGKKNVTGQLVTDPDAMADVERTDDPREYEAACVKKANEIYNRYHHELPALKRVANKAGSLCKRRGWIRNAYGRKRQLDFRFAHKAFNTLAQGCASDIVKDVMLKCGPWARERGGEMLGNKHDELLFEMPVDVDCTDVTPIAENPSVEFRVPFVWDYGESTDCWAEAKPD
jgi:DNA polymerase-1